MTDKYQRIRDALAMGPTPGPFFCGPDGNVFSVDSGEPFSEQINSAVEAARAGGDV